MKSTVFYDVCILNCGIFTVVLWISKSKMQSLKLESMWSGILRMKHFHMQISQWVQIDHTFALTNRKSLQIFFLLQHLRKNIEDSFWTKFKNLWPPLPCLHVTDMSLQWLWMSVFHRFISMCEWESEMEVSTDYRHCLICLIHGMQNILQLRGHTQTHKPTHTLLTKNGPTNSCFSPDFFILR